MDAFKNFPAAPRLKLISPVLQHPRPPVQLSKIIKAM